MSAQPDFPTIEELMARVGFLLLHWGWLENDVRDSGRRVASLADEHELAFAREIRNSLAHGLYGASADPNRWPEPFLMCRSAEGEERRVSFSDLKVAIDAISAYRGRMRREPPQDRA